MNQRNLAMVEAMIAEVWLRADRPDSALMASSRSYEMSRHMGYDDLSINALNSMARLSKSLGRDDDARKYRIMAMELADTLHNFGEYGKIKDIELQSEVTRYQAETQQERSRSRMLLWIAICLGALLLFTVVMFIVFRRKNKQLQFKDQKLFESMAEHPSEKIGEGSQGRIADVSQRVTSLPAEVAARILLKIEEKMSDESNFLNPGFTLASLAELCGETTKNVSVVLNEGLGMNFNTMLGERRVKVCVRRISDGSHYDNWTVEAIAHDLGFMSRTNFTKVFSSVTGMSPSSYLKFAAAKKQSTNRALTISLLECC